MLAAACGPPEEPVTNNGDANNNSMTANNNTPTNNNNTTTPPGNNKTTGNTNNKTTGNSNNSTTNPNNTTTTTTTTPTTTTDPPNNSNPNADCEFISMYAGQIGSAKGGGGGVLALGAGAYEADAGLQAVVDKVKAEIDAGNIVEDEDRNDDVETDAVELAEADYLTVTGAVITSTAFEKKDDQGNYIGALRMTFQDQKAGLLAFMDLITMDKDGNPVTLKVGHKVNFKVTKIKGFGANVPQIAAITDLEVVGEGVDVGIKDVSDGTALTVADYQKMVRAHGIIKTDNGGCGGTSVCYDFEYGPMGNKQTAILRSTSSFIKVGDCATYVGPMSAFPGPYDAGSDIQFNTDNFDWLRSPFKD